MAKLYNRPLPFPFVNKREGLLNLDPNQSGDSLDSTQKPPEPIIQVNDQICAVNHNASSIRNLFVLPWILALLLTCYWHVDEFFEEWASNEQTANWYIAGKKKMLGDRFFSDTVDPVEIRLFNRVDSQGKMSLGKFLDERYHYVVGGYRTFYTDIVLIILYIVVLPLLIIWAIRFPKYAPLYFDRHRRILYTWRKGQIWAQRYDHVRIHENIQALSFVLRAIKKGTLWWYVFPVQPNGNPIFNSTKSYQAFLAFIVQFMEYGKDHVLANKDFQIEPHFYFFEDNKPTSFEKDLDLLLQKIDSTDDEPAVDLSNMPSPVDLKS